MPTSFFRGPARRVAVLLALASGPGVAHGEDFDSPMYQDPEVPVARVVKTYPPGILELWLAALDRPERDAQAGAAQAILAAHASGMPGLPAAVGPLTRVLDRPDPHPAVLAAAARALVALDARDTAPALLRVARAGGPDLREAVEPALARWDYRPARDLWLERLGQPPPHGHGVMLAAQCLGAVKEERAAPRLRELALSAETSPPLRLAAARALAEIRSSGLEPDARSLAGDTNPQGMASRLAAASLLRRHQGADATRLLQQFARDPEPAVAAAAASRLAELGPDPVLGVLDPIMASPDAEVRAVAVGALLRRPSADHLTALARLLDDPHPGVRVRARGALRELADAAEWRAAVIDRGTKALAAEDRPGQERAGVWRGQEQAAILLAQLGHKPAAGRMVELFASERGEVLAAVGWGLRRLAVPDTLPAAREQVRAVHKQLLRSGPTAGLRAAKPADLDRHLSQLVQLLAMSGYKPADADLRALIPRFVAPGKPPKFTPVGPETRAAAIWALGRFHEGDPEAGLVEQIEGRLTGDGSLGRDDPRVRRMSALALGRMKAMQSLPALRNESVGTEPTADVVANACRQTVARLTGEPAPPLGTVELKQRDWFLSPLR